MLLLTNANKVGLNDRKQQTQKLKRCKSENEHLTWIVKSITVYCTFKCCF